jgi:hypothetical protein
MTLDDSIRDDAKHLRLSLRIAAVSHKEKAKQCSKLASAIDNFLGDIKPPARNTEKIEYGSNADAVRSVIFAFKERQFSLGDVENALLAIDSNRLSDRPGLRVALWKMADQGELEVIERGAGRRPTVYRAKNLKIVRYRRVT